MQQRFGFTKGMRQSISPNKADPQSYYEAMNKRVVVDNKSATASLTDEPGTNLLVSVPETRPVYTIELDGTGDLPDNILTFEFSSGDVEVDISAASADINLVYSIIMADSTLALLIAGGKLYVGLKGNKITVVFLDDSVGGLTNASSGITLTTVVPEITDWSIIASAVIRDYTILFTRSTIYGAIWKYKIVDGSVEDAVANSLVPSKHLVYNNVLYPSLTEDYQIYDVVGRYDNTDLIKIYWSNCIDELNHINIASSESLVLPTTLLSITPDCAFTQPKINNVLSGGLYYSGMVQYGYQLYNINGSETIISPLSGLVHLTPGNESASNNFSYKGADNGVLVGKAVSLTIDNIDPNFENIKIVAVYYTSVEGEPEINIVYESSIPQSKSITVIDAGDSVLSVFTPAQLNSIGTRVFSPKLLTVKDNFLIAGNLTDKYFDIDEELGSYWDARVYRYNNASASQIKYDGGSYEVVDVNQKIGGEDISEVHDCHLHKAAQDTYKYKTDGITLGGSGKNISYNFFVRSIKIDDLSNERHVITTTCGTRQQWGDSSDTIDFIEEGYSNNSSFTDYSSPVNQAEIVGYTRDEMYRFGIVFFDGKGRQSFVKWIGDIKMPKYSDTDSFVYYTDQTNQSDPETHYDIYFNCIDGSGTYANVLGINFTINTTAIPDDWNFAIVRARREDVDKTITSQGTFAFSTYNAHYDVRQPAYAYWSTTYGTLDNEPATNGVIFYYSPETKFSKNFVKTSTDSIRFLNTFKPSVYQIPSGEAGEYSKFVKPDGIGINSREILSKGIDDFIRTDVTSEVFYTLNVGGASTRICNYGFGLSAGVDDDDKMCYAASAIALGLENDTTFGITDPVQAIVNYERTLLTQYGGYSYTAKQNTVYQLSGKLRSCSGNSNTSKVFGGDTYICVFDFVQNMLDSENNIPDDNLKHKTCVYIPVETSLNLTLRHDTCPSKDTFAATSSKLTESVELGFRVWPDGGTFGAYPSNLSDLYLYNTVYSREPNGKIYSGKPLNFTSVKDNDCDVTSSERHLSGEYIDSWTNFRFNNKITVNTSNGALTKLHVFRNQVMFWQDKAFGIFSFNDRKVITDPNGTQLILGVGSVLEYFQYLSEMSGTKFTRSVVDSGAALYWYDGINRKLMMSQGGKEESISDISDVAPLFKRSEFDNPIDVIGVFDKSTRRVLFTTKNILIAGIPEYTETTVKYGLLYNWYAATDARLICADGWEVPTRAKFQTLSDYLGGNSVSGGKLKETGNVYWDVWNIATNEVGFNARGEGGRLANGTFSGLTTSTLIRIIEGAGLYRAAQIPSGFTNLYMGVSNTNSQKEGFALRLIKTTTTLTHGQTGIYTGNDGKVYRTICIGTQEWLADNLCETKYRNGDTIPEVTDNAAWAALTTGAMCAYNNDWGNAFTEITTPGVPASYSGLTVGFNERLQAFESLYSYVPNIYIVNEGKLCAVDYLSPDTVYEHNYEGAPNTFYGQAVEEGYITFVAGSDDKKVFTNIEFNSVAKSSTNEYPSQTFDSMGLENSYASATVALTQPTNLRRRFRTWRIQLPKDIEGVRYLDSYLKVKLLNTPSNNANLRLEDITIYYLIPII